MVEQQILLGLLHSPEYWSRALPHLKPEYFHDRSDKIIYELIAQYADKYGAQPTKEALEVELYKLEGVDENAFKKAADLVDALVSPEKPADVKWLLDSTEAFCQDMAVQNALRESIKILEDKEGKAGRGAIPQLLTQALSVSFDQSIGHDFMEKSDDRFAFYHKVETRIPFDIALLNKVTNGGIFRKTLTVLLAGTGVGKTLAMCHMAAANLASGLNVLYITNEMAEERIAERIEANLLDVTIDELHEIPKQTYDGRFQKLRSKTKGKLIIKEYPTSSAGAANFRHLLNELRIKKGFIPDIIYVDYLNICVSSRIRMGANVNSYTYVKAIAEELRGLAVEFNVPIITATQLNREGFVSSDPGLENTSESFGLPATADLMFAMITSDDLARLGQIMFKQLKNRYRDENLDRRFVVGIDRPKMRLYDVDSSAQKNVMQDTPQTTSQKALAAMGTSQKIDKSRFQDFS